MLSLEVSGAGGGRQSGFYRWCWHAPSMLPPIIYCCHIYEARKSMLMKCAFPLFCVCECTLICICSVVLTYMQSEVWNMHDLEILQLVKAGCDQIWTMDDINIYFFLLYLLSNVEFPRGDKFSVSYWHGTNSIEKIIKYKEWVPRTNLIIYSCSSIAKNIYKKTYS